VSLTGPEIFSKALTYVEEVWANQPLTAPAVIPLSVSEYKTLMVYLEKYPYSISPSFNFYRDLPTVNLYGVPIVILHFDDDPKFRTFQSMAALAGARIQYDIGDDKRTINSAVFVSPNSSWVYMPARDSVESRVYSTSCGSKGIETKVML